MLQVRFSRCESRKVTLGKFIVERHGYYVNFFFFLLEQIREQANNNKKKPAPKKS